jgi:hypothetical protein
MELDIVDQMEAFRGRGREVDAPDSSRRALQV